jgi:hypothetical protein
MRLSLTCSFASDIPHWKPLTSPFIGKNVVKTGASEKYYKLKISLLPVPKLGAILNKRQKAASIRIMGT